jgi:integrase
LGKRLAEELRHPAHLFLHDAIAQYLAVKAKKVGEVWLRTLEERLRGFLPNEPIPYLSPAQAASLYEAETQRQGRFGIVSAATHQALLRNTKEFFRWLSKQGLCAANPFEAVEPLGRVNAGKVQPLRSEVQKLDVTLFKAAAAGDEGALALLVQLYVGLRSAEVLRLVVDVIEPEGRYLTVVRGKTKNSRRRLEVCDDVARLLWAHAKARPPEQRVFAANLRTQPGTDWLYKRLKRFCREAGIREVCPHSLRGLHSTLALAAGATTHAVAANLGHGSFSVTQRHYADPSTVENARLRQVVATLRTGGLPSGLEAEIAALSEEQRHVLRKLLHSA